MENIAISTGRLNAPVMRSHEPFNVGKVNFHFFRSYLSETIFKTTLATACIAFIALVPETIALFQAVGLAIPLLLTGIAATMFLINVYLLRKEVMFEISLIYTYFTADDWATPINDRLILGAIPLENHAEPLKNRKVKVLVSMLDPFELIPALVTPLNSIERKHIHAQDFFGVPVENIKEGVDFLKERMDAGDICYVHCKAGRGRSTAIVLAYILTHGLGEKKFADYDEAYAFVKKLRPQINLNSRQRSTVIDYWNTYCQNKTSNSL